MVNVRPELGSPIEHGAATQQAIDTPDAARAGELEPSEAEARLAVRLAALERALDQLGGLVGQAEAKQRFQMQAGVLGRGTALALLGVVSGRSKAALRPALVSSRIEPSDLARILAAVGDGPYPIMILAPEHASPRLREFFGAPKQDPSEPK